MIEQAEGNLLEAEVDALVNTVNCVGVMGKGIALQFKQAFPQMTKAYEAACRAGEVRLGEMHVWESDVPFTSPRYIINFPTKQHWKSKSRLVDVRTGLDALVEEIKRRGIKSIAVPPLGCGNGGLNWSEVAPLIEAAFEQLPSVRVLVYAPKGAPAVADRVIRTAKKPLNATRAVLLAAVRRYAALGYSISLLEIQKVAYFLQEAGALVKLNYSKQMYGPYADNLNFVLQDLEGHYLHGFDGDRAPVKEIELDESGVNEAEQFLHGDDERLGALARVAELIEGFETPYGMELLSSVHWVATRNGAKSVDEAIVQVHAWTSRKKELFAEDHIRVAWDQLSRQGWLSSVTA